MICVSITRAELIRKGACREGIALFDSIAFNGEWIGEFTPLRCLWLATAYPAFTSWLRSNGTIPAADLRGADLRGADLSGADLSGADLSGAYLRGADLSRADLSAADLRGACLYWAYLRGADLSRADMSGAYRPEGSPGYQIVNGYLKKVRS